MEQTDKKELTENEIQEIELIIFLVLRELVGIQQKKNG